MAISPWAHLVVGGPRLSDDFFSGGHTSDFTQPLDGGLNAGGILGTTRGYGNDNNPFDFTYPTDGQYKMGTPLQFHQNYATGYQYPGVSDQRNKEPMHIVHPHSAGNPNYMDFFEVRNGMLVMKTKLNSASDKNWARIKGYAIMPNGREATYSWFVLNGGVPFGWAPTSLSPPSGDMNEAVFFHNMPANYSCPMISDLNRRAMSFGRHEGEYSLPTGARVNGNVSDLRNIEAHFPAHWLQEDVPAGCDLNGVKHDADTHTPANPGAGDVLGELDIEVFGYEKKIHLTSHHYLTGNSGFTQTVNGIEIRRTERIQANHTPPYPSTLVEPGSFFKGSIDVLPPFEDQAGVICYSINGIVEALYPLPDYLGKPKNIYVPVEGLPYLPRLKSDYTPYSLGTQRYEDGKEAYTHWFGILNNSMSAGFIRSQSVNALLTGTAPEFIDEPELLVRHLSTKPLNTNNPDSRPFFDYTAGDFGGSITDFKLPEEEPDPNNDSGIFCGYKAINDRPNGGKLMVPCRR